MLLNGTVEIRVYKKDIRFVMSATFTNPNTIYTYYDIGYWMFKFGTKLNRIYYQKETIKNVTKIFRDIGFTINDDITNYKYINPGCSPEFETVMLDLGERDLYSKGEIWHKVKWNSIW